MLDNKIKESLHNIFLSMPKESLPKKGDGWVNENQFAKAVLKERINFKDMGYTWFNEFLKDSGIFVFCKEWKSHSALTLLAKQDCSPWP